MKTQLVFPDGRREDLTFTTDHPQSSYGLGVLLRANGQILDGLNFHLMRLSGFSIETDDEAGVRGALAYQGGGIEGRKE